MLIIGTRFFTWGSEMTTQPWRCNKCGHAGQFVMKKGMRFLTIFFIIPLIPLSGITNLVQCPNCKTRYQSQPKAQAAGV